VGQGQNFSEQPEGIRDCIACGNGWISTHSKRVALPISNEQGVTQVNGFINPVEQNKELILSRETIGFRTTLPLFFILHLYV